MLDAKSYDIIVVGAGHAGCEAALVSARLGKKTLLCTMNLDTIAQLSCNPAMGGIAKGQLIREVDALGGEIGKNTDKALIQFQMLNTSKGAAVRSPRAQCDKHKYHLEMKAVLENTENLDIAQAEIIEFLVEENTITGVKTRLGMIYSAKAVILTAGTFLNGKIYIGDVAYEGGRSGEAPSNILSENLKHLGFTLERLKTGTPMRVLKNSIDFSNMEPQSGDDVIYPFSFSTQTKLENKEKCWITYTNDNTHEIIRKNLHRSPLHGNNKTISGIGPRYCPSLEDKVLRFSEMHRHQVFIEPESLDSNELYCNGISSSLPADVQIDFLHSITGLENAKVTRIGYAIEYDFAPPTQLKPTLETKNISGLFFAGQINGTTGYEEAAAQGIMAGINAVLALNKKEPFILQRHEAYIGVLIDDLVTKGVLDPYRMFTSRAEHRLLLRNDNIDERLLHYGFDFGLINDELYKKYKLYRVLLDETKQKLENLRDDKHISYAQNIRRDSAYKEWVPMFINQFENELKNNYPWDTNLIIENINTEIKYHGYVELEKREVNRQLALEEKIIPENINYDEIIGLLSESRQKLKKINPRTIGQARRISGVTSADISLILIYLKKNKK